MFQDDFKLNVARSFGRAAGSYDGVAGLQRRIGRALMDQLPPLSPDAVVLDLGAGTGFFARHLAMVCPYGQVIALDIAEPMIRRAKETLERGCVVGDAEFIPLRAASVDLVFSNMCIQWCQSPDRLFAEIKRILKPQGVVIFSTFGPKTLMELRQAWQSSDRYDHVIDFRSSTELKGVLEAAGLCWSDQQVWLERCPYPNVHALMRELQGIGARNASVNRSRAMTGKGRFAAMMAAYPLAGPESGEGIIATFEILGGWLRCAGDGV